MFILNACLVLFLAFNVKAEEKSAADIDDSILPSEEDFVFVLNAKNFENFVQNNEITVVFFYAPWCGHCVSMKPFYHEAAKILRNDESVKSDKPVVFAKVDATIEQDLASRFQIQGYPTLKIFRKGVPYEYDGPRKGGKEIAQYLVKEASNDWKPPVSQVKVLTNANFTEWVEKYDISLVEFYSPGCGHCIQLAPNYEKAAKILAEEASPIPLAKVDATEELELSQKYKISGYPTLFVFRKGRHYEYKGGRQTHEIVSTMLKARSSASKEISTFKQFLVNVKTPTETYVIGLFENKENPMFEIYSDLASKYSEDLNLFHTFNTKEFLTNVNKDIKVPSILVYHHDLAVAKKEPKFKAYDKQTPTLEALEAFVFKDSLPLVSHMSPKNQHLIFDKIKPICYVIYDIDIELRTYLNSLRDRVGNVARKFKQIQFALVNQTDNSEFVKRFNLEEAESDMNLVCLNEKSKAFIYNNEDEALDEDDASSFVQKFISGKLKPYIRSEPVIKQNPQNPVKTVVGKTFEEIVIKNKKDILIAFVGLASKQTADFELEFSKIAKKYSTDSKYKSLEFAKIDMFKNDFPEELNPSKHKPTVYYISSGDISHAVEFKEEMNVANLNKFIEKNYLKNKKGEL